MSLDMYLTAERYIWTSEQNISQKICMALKIKEFRAEKIVFAAAYWLDAHAIHDWFVNEVNAKAENYEKIEVSFEQLSKLKKCCLVVLQDKKLAKQLIPHRSAIDAYGKSYFSNLENAVGQIDRILKEFEDDSLSYTLFYKASA